MTEPEDTPFDFIDGTNAIFRDQYGRPCNLYMSKHGPGVQQNNGLWVHLSWDHIQQLAALDPRRTKGADDGRA